MNKVYEPTIVTIDDDEASVRQILTSLETSLWWRTNPLELGDSDVVIQPTVEGIFPNQNEGLKSYLDRVRARIFGEATDSAAASEAYDSSIIFLVDWKFELNWSANDGPKPDGISLCREIKKYIPHAFCCLITAHNSLETNETDFDAFETAIEKGDLDHQGGIDLLARKITEHLQINAQSPTWDGLLKYASMDKEIFHALGVGDGQNRSITSSGFIEKFGQNLFSAEASLTLEPLDSLLAPNGCIVESQNLFAKAFGARKARFCTNGTTGANSILWSALFDDGDVVIVDRNCHISHHYSAAMQNAIPLYVNPEVAVDPDVFGPVALSSVLDLLKTAAKDGYVEKIKGLVLTNCTFDGYVLNATEYVEAIDQFLRGIGLSNLADQFVYVFDEAWFSFARFDPGLIRFTGMFAATHAQLPGNVKPRVYVTQSVHKTLTALRQASVILESDHFLDGDNQASGLETQRFKQSYLARTTTSPSAPIVASFDIARRQMALEGGTLIQDSVKAINDLKGLLFGNKWGSVKQYFDPTPPHGRARETEANLVKDPTKLTIFHKLNVSSAAAKTRMWNIGRVQVNKYGEDSLMFMFMPGFKKSRITSLLSKLKLIVADSNPDEVSSEIDRMSIPNLQFCLGKDHKPLEYPKGVITEGGWAMRDMLFSKTGRLAVPTKSEELNDTDQYVVGSFITPYPPGFPIFYPGQVVTGAEIKQVFSIPGEVHGRSAEGEISLWKLSLR
ncbi:beta-eliminating lyase-related protein [uncultured Tateyamaria sp.]|uniref:beta-eliminating lyase-related protein n=1 Tax=uncultured Tateyamaria sp. TaxID=455651 RepID=UPI00261F1617|nr:beta-eliminating lyase-related protein [uncultured Tateyamaria sp.]